MDLQALEKLVYTITTASCWAFFDWLLFHNWVRHRYKCFLYVLILSCIQMLGALLFGGLLTPALMIGGSIILSFTEHKKKWRAHFIEQSFTYAISAISGILCALFSSMLCVFVLRTPIHAMTTAIRVGLILLECLAAYVLFRQQDFAKLGEKYAPGIFGIVTAFFFAVFSRFRVPYESANKELYIFLTLAMFTCITLYIAWAKREQRVLKDMEAAAQVKSERDNLVSQNHKLSKALPALENQYEELQTKVAVLKSYGVEGFSEELIQKKHTITKVRSELEAQNMQEYYELRQIDTTGIDLLDSELKYRAREAAGKGVCFDCHVISPADVLIKQKVISDTQLQQLLSNLLDNAIHSAAKGGVERAVVCSMGEAGTAYQIKISDTGPYFEPHILSNLGQPYNTTDGTGVGLLHVMQILSACHASFSIEEYNPQRPSGITKSITVRFDGKDSVLIRPGRQMEGGEPDGLVYHNREGL